MRLSRHFKLSEVACRCGNCETNLEDINMNLIRCLQTLRDKFGLPIKIASGYRCPEHNKAIGGATKSQHILGRAVDISIGHLSSADLHRLLRLIYSSNSFTGVGVGSGKLHIDVRETETQITWMY